MKFRFIFVFVLFILSITFFPTTRAFADSASGYAWSENSGWIDFSQVTVASDVLAGYAYSPNIGWISLNCSNTSSCGTTDYKVTNSSGTLSGYAWSENTGWLDFSQATINTSTGVFSGYVYSSNIGWVSMNCDNTSSCGTVDYKVSTSWRPPHRSSSGSILIRTQCNDGIDNDGDGLVDSADPECRANGPRTSESPLVPTTPPTTPPVVITCTLNFTQILKLTIPRMNNENIKSLQSCLNTKPTTYIPLIPDGIFGFKTQQVVMNFQKAKNIKIDGIVGPITRGLLIK